MKARYVRWVGLGLVLIGVILLGVWGARVYRTVHSLLGYVEEAQALVDGGSLPDVDLARAGRLVYGVRSDIVTLRRDVGWAARLGPAFRWVPSAGPLLADAPALLDLADALTELGALFWDDAALGLTLLAHGIAPLEALVFVQPRIAAEVPEARVMVARAAAAYSDVDVALLPGRLQMLALLEPVLPLADDGLAWVEVIPALLGVDAQRAYLVLVLNEGELRPGGGFITGVGELRIEAGKVVSMNFSDSYAVDDFTQPYPLAPEPFRQFMGIDLWVFRDSNWSPDFPTAARQALELYRPGYPVTVDGVIAIDQYATQVLVDAIGPLMLPGGGEPVTGAKLLDYIYDTWSPEDGKFDGEWWKARKSFMGPLAEAVLARIKRGEIDWAALAQRGLRLVEQKHVLVYLADASASALLEERGWDGALRPPQGDYLLVVEANVGFNKASAKLLRNYTYDVDLTQSPPRATVTLSYTHTSQVEIACKSEARYDPEYMQMMDRCYWGHLRLYVPEGAQLVSASRHPIPAKSVANGKPWDGQARIMPAPEGGYTVFEQVMLLPTASQVTVQFTYTLPESVVASAPSDMPDDALIYQLLWQKQAGLQALPARIILRLPRNAVLCPSQPRSTLDANGVLFYDMALDVDRSFSVCYRLLEEGGK